MLPEHMSQQQEHTMSELAKHDEKSKETAGRTRCWLNDMHDQGRGVVIAAQAKAVGSAPLQGYNVLHSQAEAFCLFIFLMVSSIIQVL